MRRQIKPEYRAIRTKLDELSEDKAVQKERKRAAYFVTERLQNQIYAELDAMGLTAEMREKFLAGTEPNYTHAKKIILEHLPRELGRQFKNLLSSDKEESTQSFKVEEAFQVLLDYRQWKTQIAFRKAANIKPNTWDPFLRGENYIYEETIEKISRTLGLTEEEDKAFRALLPRENFPVTEDFLKELTKKMQGKGFYEDEYHIGDFLAHTYLSPDAWNNLHHANTSQKTMLKLLIGLTMDEAEGRQFLNLVNSGFFVYRDMVVLACIRCNFYDVIELTDILHYFAQNPTGDPYYKNLY